MNLFLLTTICVLLIKISSTDDELHKKLKKLLEENSNTKTSHVTLDQHEKDLKELKMNILQRLKYFEELHHSDEDRNMRGKQKQYKPRSDLTRIQPKIDDNYHVGKDISIGSLDKKRQLKKLPNIQERNNYYNRKSVPPGFDHMFKKEKHVPKNKLPIMPTKKQQPFLQNTFQMKSDSHPNQKEITNKKIQRKPDEEIRKKVKNTFRDPIKEDKLYHHKHQKPLLLNKWRSKLGTGKIFGKIQTKALDPNLVNNVQSKGERKAISEKVNVRKNATDHMKKRLNIDEEDNKQRLNIIGSPVNYLRMPEKQLPVTMHDKDDTSIADQLAKKVRVLCWVLTYPANHNLTLEAIKKTWGSRCNKLIFMTTKHEPGYPTVRLKVKEGRDNLWPKVKAAYMYVFQHHRYDYDWFLRTDDDTYIIMENLRYMLAGYNPKAPLYFGCRFKPFTTQGYMSGGAGIVLSQNALVRLARGLSKKMFCEPPDNDNENDDVNLGICLNRVGVRAMDTRDALQRSRFLPFMPQTIMTDALKQDSWFWSYIYYPAKKGLACCSDYTISFHYVSPEDMYALDFLIYRLRPYGVKFGSASLAEIPDKRKYSISLKLPEQSIEPSPIETENEIEDYETDDTQFKIVTEATPESTSVIITGDITVDPLDSIQNDAKEHELRSDILEPMEAAIFEENSADTSKILDVRRVDLRDAYEDLSNERVPEVNYITSKESPEDEGKDTPELRYSISKEIQRAFSEIIARHNDEKSYEVTGKNYLKREHYHPVTAVLDLRKSIHVLK